MADFYGVSSNTFGILNLLHEAVERTGAHVEKVDLNITPEKISIMFLLTESHLSLHAFIKQKRWFVDCYTCGETVYPSRAIDMLINTLDFQYVYRHELIRGVQEDAH